MKERRVPDISKHKRNSNKQAQTQLGSKLKGNDKKKILNVENKGHVEMTHSVEAKKTKKRAGCHWTCGNKMFSKTEKVQQKQLFVE